MGILEVAGYQTSEPFLSGSVPQLQSIILGVMGHIFSEEVDADGGLNDG